MIISIGQPLAKPGLGQQLLGAGDVGGRQQISAEVGMRRRDRRDRGAPWPNIAMSVKACRSTILMKASRTRGSSNGLKALFKMMPCQLPARDLLHARYRLSLS